MGNGFQAGEEGGGRVREGGEGGTRERKVGGEKKEGGRKGTRFRRGKEKGERREGERAQEQ